MNHLKVHAMQGLVRPATPEERAAGSAFFTLTLEGQAFVARRQADPTAPRPPALPHLGTRARRVYDIIAEYPGVRLLAIEIADESGLRLQLASAVAHGLAHRRLVKLETGGRGRQAEFWVDV
jgi:hypothetical protein